MEAQIKEKIEKEKETPEWTEDKYENAVNKIKLDFQVRTSVFSQ